MPRFSPSVQRVVAVLNLFADHPDQAFTLTDIVRTLKLSRATCHGLLLSLVEAGYLYRTTDKSYVLGAALLHVGEMAKTHFSPLKVALPFQLGSPPGNIGNEIVCCTTTSGPCGTSF